MSWSVNLTTTIDEARAKLEESRDAALSQNPECRDQYDAARDVTFALMLSGAVGGHQKTFYVVMSGHANPDHEPRPGWANDCVNVSVSQS